MVVKRPMMHSIIQLDEHLKRDQLITRSHNIIIHDMLAVLIDMYRQTVSRKVTNSLIMPVNPKPKQIFATFAL